MELFQDNNIDIAFISETWLTDMKNVTTSSIKSYGYDIVHDYRTDMRGGGCGIIFKDSTMKVKVVNIDTPEISTFCYIAGKVYGVTDFQQMVFISVYRTGPVSNKFFTDFNDLLGKASLQYEHVVVAGDFNIHMECVSNESKKLSEVTESYGFRLLSEEPTHKDGGCIDLVFFNSDLFDVESTTIDYDQNMSDHFPVFSTSIRLDLSIKATKTITYRDLKNVDHTSLKIDLTEFISSFTIVNGEQFKSCIFRFFDSLHELLNEHAPFVSKTMSDVPHSPWFDTEYKQQRAKCRKAERIWRKTKSHQDNIYYLDMVLDTKILRNSKKKQYYGSMIENNTNNVRTLYNVLDKELDRKKVSPLPDADSIDKLAADFNSYFVDKIKGIMDNFNKPDCPVDSTSQHHSDYLNEFEPCTIEELEDIIQNTEIKCAPDDFLPTEIIIDNIDSFLPILCDLVNFSLKIGSIDGLKIADIIPTLKDLSLDPNNLKNYRTISNLSYLGKLIERVVLKRINDHMDSNGMHTPEQSAYKKHHSTETILVKITNDLLCAFDSKSATVLLMLDLSAAFDTVSHSLLLNILNKEIKLGGTVLKWFKSFLTGRAQHIRLGSVTSEDVELLFGVPQGSVLGPVLFNIYTRSLYTVIKNASFNVQGYADDQQVYKSFKPCEQSLILSASISECFRTIQSWMVEYCLQLNPGKTKIMVFAPPNVLSNISIRGLFLPGNICVRFTSTAKNLGVTFDETLNFQSHIAKVKRDSFRMLRNINKRRFLFTKDQLTIIVNSLIACKLDYCNAVYYGVNEQLLQELQRVQNAAAKTVVGLYKYDHVGNTLKDLHWLPVKQRIKYKILLLVFKCLNSMGPQYLSTNLNYANIIGQNVQLQEPMMNSVYGDRAFVMAGPKLWNMLPNNVKQCSCIVSFKTALKTHLFVEAFGN